MGYAYIGRNPGQLYEANFLHSEVLSIVNNPAFAGVDYTIWDPRQRKPFSWGWSCNDGQYVDPADALKLGQALQAYLSTPAAYQAYKEFYDRQYVHMKISYEGNPPTRSEALTQFMKHAHEWANFLVNSGGFEIR